MSTVLSWRVKEIIDMEVNISQLELDILRGVHDREGKIKTVRFIQDSKDIDMESALTIYNHMIEGGVL